MVQSLLRVLGNNKISILDKKYEKKEKRQLL